MSGNVFLVPCVPEHFDRTVRSAVDLAEHPDRPEALADLSAARFFGVDATGDNRTYFEKMEPDDLVLFYHDGTFVGTGWIDRTFEDAEDWASSTFWAGDTGSESAEGDGDNNGDGAATLLFTIDGFEPVTVPKAAVNRIFEYSDGYTPGGFIRVAEGRVANEPAAIKLALKRYGQES